MPIRPENKARYPANWSSEIVPLIRERSGNRCEGSPAYPDCRLVNGWHGYRDDAGVFHHVDPKEAARWSGVVHGYKTFRVVLTVAHLDHIPENCDPSNLMHWCQRCHLVYDSRHHATNRARNRHAALPINDLFEVSHVENC